MLISPLVIGAILGFLGTGQAKNISTLVDLGYSKYEGVHGSDGVSRWWGIRYGAAPLGDLRFRAPQDPPSTGNQVILADKHAPSCRGSQYLLFDPLQSEDCLFLDLYAPTEKKDRLPVYVYIQGGGLNYAGANMDATKLVVAADHEIIIVNFGYRVGPFGFLASKEVEADGDLNNGMLDQRKVLRWVQKHIAKFGGDPKRVTLAGSSAGSASVGIQLTAYGGRDDKLFAAVHHESPSFGYARTIKDSQYQYDALVERVNCSSARDTLKCLRNQPTETIPNNNPLDIPAPGGGGGPAVFLWSSCIDGDLIRDQPFKQFAAGNYVKVPAIYGSDTNEGTVFTPHTISNYTEMNNFLKNNWPKLTAFQLARIDFLYPKAEQFPDRGPYFRTAANAYGDLRYTCPGLYLSSKFGDDGVQNIYNYRWDVLTEANALNGDGVTHTAGVAPTWGLYLPGSPEANISPYIQSYITSFIRTSGNPNLYRLKGSPEWTRYSEQNAKRMHFPNDPYEVGMESVTSGQKKKCGYLSSISPVIGQ
ncbi:Alpha/Beta hydrolase protein [Leptodontidium sp. 2 PMI_412]|nr:Alpha/Beta hydrolase protein [Leptodontidium sp. 2 PMI_412]